MKNSCRLRRLTTRIALPGLVLVMCPVVSAQAATNPPQTAASAGARASVSDKGAAVSAKAPDIRWMSTARFWTPSRMKAARPADLAAVPGPTPQTMLAAASAVTSSGGSQQTLSSPVSPRPVAVRPTVPGGKTTYVKPTAAPSGKLFFTIDGEPFVCSASSVNSPNRSLIITAGHCVHEGPSGAWFDDFAYVPGYRDGRAPYGIWGWEEVNTFKGWSKFGDSDYDQALIQVEKLNGRRLVDKVGAHGLTTGVSQAQKAVRAVGWPAAEPFTGERVVTCDGATTRRAKTNDAALRCRMTGGSSGGPWLIKRVAPMQGNVFAVTSRGARSGTPTIFAAPIRPAIKDLVKSIG